VVFNDLKTLILRLAYNEALNVDTGGGGKESNFKLLVPMLALADFLLQAKGEKGGANSRTGLRSHSSLQRLLKAFIHYQSEEKSSIKGSFYPDFAFCATATLFVFGFDEWNKHLPTFVTGAMQYAELVEKNMVLNGSGAVSPKKRIKSPSNSESSQIDSTKDSTQTNRAAMKAGLLFLGVVNELHKSFRIVAAANDSDSARPIEIWYSSEISAIQSCEGLFSLFSKLQDMRIEDLKEYLLKKIE